MVGVKLPTDVLCPRELSGYENGFVARGTREILRCKLAKQRGQKGGRQIRKSPAAFGERRELRATPTYAPIKKKFSESIECMII